MGWIKENAFKRSSAKFSRELKSNKIKWTYVSSQLSVGLKWMIRKFQMSNTIEVKSINT